MYTCHNPLHCYLPPYVLKNLAQCEDPEIRRLAIEALEASAEARAIRATMGAIATIAPMFSSTPISTKKNRLVYDMEERRFVLPGKLVRREGEDPTGDSAVDEAYDHAGITYDFYKQRFNRNSIDNRGMDLISSVHVGRQYNNAFWNGRQMAYGDGDGQIFIRFTKALDVAGHEITHGVITHESNLEYQGESGALNESFADVMGALVQQWHLGQNDPNTADWDMGELIMGSSPATRLRTFKAEKAYEDDPYLGTDRQPKHIRDKYTGLEDNGGVHINSGIPNHAFYLIALDIGGPSWEKAGKIWYQTLRNLNSQSDFQEAADMTYQVAGQLFGNGSLEQQAVKQGWDGVGINISSGSW
ncbi:putative peptidase M4, thermolysin [Crocosphaera subtropica ATCC 51142]|uniref:Neutral metalloproteinase n=1 Tax=Crocosphaera subtropica (strain ATCC 51142 / BH68) TaxID=43989 RepID=B1WSX9_CROS5|nr:M4 family metallopeptidase [Crocosphaera subtropica]ACB50309.1 putative peptidase M4, thermolysin [Crocosphaera subtropica ATCC 51142]